MRNVVKLINIFKVIYITGLGDRYIYNYMRNQCLSVVGSNPVHCEVYSIQNYEIKFVSDLHRVRVMMVNVTFNYLSVISWQSVSLVEEIHLPAASH
jgi:hypothetical protein